MADRENGDIQSEKKTTNWVKPSILKKEVVCPSCGKTIPLIGGRPMKRCPFCKQTMDESV